MSEYTGFIASFLIIASLIPQIIKSIRSGRTEDLSLMMICMSFAGNIFWLANGYQTQNHALMASGFLLAGLNVPLLYLKMGLKATLVPKRTMPAIAIFAVLFVI